jgi:hypothetical protein
MTIVHRFGGSPLSPLTLNLPLHRSEPPTAKRRKLNQRENGAMMPMSVEKCDDNNTMMEVEQSPQVCVEELFQVCTQEANVSLVFLVFSLTFFFLQELLHETNLPSFGEIQQSCLARGIQLSSDARAELKRLVSSYWE